MAGFFAANNRKLGSALLVAALFVPALAGPGSAGSGYRKRTTEIAPGVTLTSIRNPKGPLRIKIVEVDLSGSPTVDVALAQDVLAGFETTSSMASRHGAIAAINGDYARPNGRPVMTFAEDGRLAQTPLAWGRNFAVSQDETTSFIGHPEVTAWAHESDVGIDHEVAKVNEGKPKLSAMAQFTQDGPPIEKPPPFSCSARLMPSTTPRFRTAGGPGIEETQIVDAVKCADTRLSMSGGNVLSAPIGGTFDPVIRALVPGEEIVLGWSLGWTGVMDTIGGNPTLVDGGEILDANVDGEGWFFEKHPRTGIGVTSNGTLLLITVDGRQPDWSVGMTLRRFAKLFQNLGAVTALNLDGGGSTTMVVNGQVRNRPSDESERAVSSALLILPGSDIEESDPNTSPSPSPSPSLGGSEAIWNAMANDGGSVGGLAWYLDERGKLLPNFLSRALRLLEAR